MKWPSFPRWPVDRPRTISGRPVGIVAHRGYHRREPENSLAAFAEALVMGSDGIEVDVRLAGDGALVCFHDWYLKRLTGTSGRVGRVGMEHLLETPLVHPRTLRRRPVATLGEVLTLVEDRAHLVLDLKKESVRPSALEGNTIRHLREFGLQETVTISSFNPWVLRRVKQLAPEFSTALIASSRLGVRLFNPDYCDGIHVHHALLARRWFWRVAGSFRRIMVWTVDRRADLHFPLPDNIGGIITNRPDRWGARGPVTRRITLRATEGRP
jgi:glycerophosphoryl diester phosphodiesterase